MIPDMHRIGREAQRIAVRLLSRCLEQIWVQSPQKKALHFLSYFFCDSFKRSLWRVIGGSNHLVEFFEFIYSELNFKGFSKKIRDLQYNSAKIFVIHG